MGSIQLSLFLICRILDCLFSVASCECLTIKFNERVEDYEED
jgi:hypothetical protein